MKVQYLDEVIPFGWLALTYNHNPPLTIPEDRAMTMRLSLSCRDTMRQRRCGWLPEVIPGGWTPFLSSAIADRGRNAGRTVMSVVPWLLGAIQGGLVPRRASSSGDQLLSRGALQWQSLGSPLFSSILFRCATYRPNVISSSLLAGLICIPVRAPAAESVVVPLSLARTPMSLLIYSNQRQLRR